MLTLFLILKGILLEKLVRAMKSIKPHIRAPTNFIHTDFKIFKATFL